MAYEDKLFQCISCGFALVQMAKHVIAIARIVIWCTDALEFALLQFLRTSSVLVLHGVGAICIVFLGLQEIWFGKRESMMSFAYQ